MQRAYYVSTATTLGPKEQSEFSSVNLGAKSLKDVVHFPGGRVLGTLNFNVVVVCKLLAMP